MGLGWRIKFGRGGEESSVVVKEKCGRDGGESSVGVEEKSQ